MRNPIVVEDIEGMRRRQGIDDVELREEIRKLRSGDFVKVTLLTRTGSYGGETLLVRIARIKGSVFYGELAMRPTCNSLAKLRIGSPVHFTAAHIHSIAKRPSRNEH